MSIAENQLEGADDDVDLSESLSSKDDNYKDYRPKDKLQVPKGASHCSTHAPPSPYQNTRDRRRFQVWEKIQNINKNSKQSTLLADLTLTDGAESERREWR